MNVLVVTNSCSLNRFAEIEKERTRKVLGAQQKFFYFIIQGLATDENNNIDVLVIPPVSASSHKKRWWKAMEEKTQKNIFYRYVGFINGKISRYITQYMATKKAAVKWMKNHNVKDSIVLCDPLLVHVTLGVQKEAKRYGFKTMAVVTDIPVFVTDVLKSRLGKIKYHLLNLYDYVTEKKMKQYDSYVLLTKQMNAVVNPFNKPYIIMEGISDSHSIEDKNIIKKKVCVYAGGIFERYGVLKLARAFSKLNQDEWELHFYGTGNDVEQLVEFCNQHPKVKYLGTLPQKEIVKVESEALLLINPRPSDEIYTAFSFPSKTTEYMSSGTAVLSTKLPGIPEDYYPYLYWFTEEDEKSIALTLESILSKSSHELIEFGLCGKNFVVQNKGFISQGRRLHKFAIDITGQEK